MNRKQFLYLLAAVVILGGAGIAVFWNNLRGYQNDGATIGAKVLPQLKASEASEIHLKNANQEITLISKKGSWSVKERGGYPADLGQISELLAKLVEAKVTQSQQVAPSLYGRLELNEPGKAEGVGTVLDLKDQKGQPLAHLVFGKVAKKKDPGNPLPNAVDGVAAGRYLIAPGKIANVVVVSDPFENANPKPSLWLAKNFIKIDRLKSLASRSAKGSWKIARELEYSQWKFAATGGMLDPSAAGAAAKALGELEFIDVATEPKVEGENPVTLVADTFDNLTYTIKISKKKDSEDYYFNAVLTGQAPKTRTPEKDEKPDEVTRRAKEYQDTLRLLEARIEFEKILGQWTYVMSAKTLEALLKDNTQMLVQARKTEAAPSAAGMPPGMGVPH